MASDAPSDGLRSPICFLNRAEAGERLADAVLAELVEHPVPVDASFIVYALPRGGLPIALPIAQRLNCPLTVLVAKKVTRPDNPELAIGAVTAEGCVLWLPRTRSRQLISESECEEALEEARQRAQAQWGQLSPYCPTVNPAGAIALIVDDGIATGMTIAVAAQALRTHQPAQIWLCVPVAPPEIMPQLRSWGDRAVVLVTPDPFYSVSRFYKTFPQVEMDSAIACLQESQRVEGQE